MKYFAVNGSPRSNGNTATLLKLLTDQLETRGFEGNTVGCAGKSIRGCTACMKCFETKNSKCVIDSDPVNQWIKEMEASDVVILATPTYFANVSPELKALMDRTGLVTRASGMTLKRKIGVPLVSARRAGAVPAFDAINHFLHIEGMILPGCSYWNLAYAGKEVVELDDKEGQDTLVNLADNIEWLCDKLTR
jgi:multimeric flavodoxin WrbA